MLCSVLVGHLYLLYFESKKCLPSFPLKLFPFVCEPIDLSNLFAFLSLKHPNFLSVFHLNYNEAAKKSKKTVAVVNFPLKIRASVYLKKLIWDVKLSKLHTVS